MEDLPRETEDHQLSLACFPERNDTGAIAERTEVDRYRPVCTSVNDQVCQIHNHLPYCNELLFDVGLELREQRGGSLSLVSIDVNLMPAPGPDSYRATGYLRWLLGTHLCITALELSDDSDKSHSKMVLRELPDNTRLKKLALRLLLDDNSHAHLAKHLPRLRTLEVLSCSARPQSLFSSPWSSCTDAVVAVSALLKSTKCLTYLTFHGCFGPLQPPKTFIEALAANSTLKCFNLETEWVTIDTPGPLVEYVRSNGLLTSLTVSGRDVDREDLLLEETLVRNGTLSTLYVLNLCGGENSVRFLTRIIAECSALRKLHFGLPQISYTEIPETILTRCTEALAQNQTLAELALHYSLWHPNNWIAFFALLPRNKHLKKLDVYGVSTQDYPTIPPVLEALGLENTSIRVSFFGPHVPGEEANLMHYSVFSRIVLFGEESVQVDALQRLPLSSHFTALSLDVHAASERLFSVLAKYIRETTTLQELGFTVTDPFDAANNTATQSCWTLLFRSLSANKSIARVHIYSDGNFQYNDRLTLTIGHSRYIRRVFFLDNWGRADATELVSLLSEAIVGNYNLLQVNLCGTKVGVQAKRCFFIIQDTLRRNCGLVERAAAFNRTTPLDWYTASALEKVARNPALVRELAEKEDIAASEVARMIRSRLRSVEGLHDFMRLAGVVKKCVTCVPPVDGCRMQLQDLNDDCWRLVRRYISFDDVKRFSITSKDHTTSS